MTTTLRSELSAAVATYERALCRPLLPHEQARLEAELLLIVRRENERLVWPEPLTEFEREMMGFV